MPTQMRIRDILEAPNLPIDEYDISRVVELVAERYFDLNDWPLFPDEGIAPYKVELKGYRNYDHTRSAALYVIYHGNDVICICSFAGRSMQDTDNISVFDSNKLRKLVYMFFSNSIFTKQDLKFDENNSVDVVYWEGCPIQLGKNIFGYDK